MQRYLATHTKYIQFMQNSAQSRNECIPSTLRTGKIFSHTFELSYLAGLAPGAPPCTDKYIGIMMVPF
jgi:hypothetical protein